jgi:hypothetical protein
MNRDRVFNWLLGAAIAATLILIFDQPEPAPSAEVLTAEQLARDRCGPGAALYWLDDGSIKCGPHNRHRPASASGVKP